VVVVVAVVAVVVVAAFAIVDDVALEDEVGAAAAINCDATGLPRPVTMS
jgi:hypothetical protein